MSIPTNDRMPLIVRHKELTAPSIFVAENMLREARRQKGTTEGSIPQICVLDPDGDIVGGLLRTGQAKLDPTWACYHTKLYNFHYDLAAPGQSRSELQAERLTIGIVGYAVGAPFAVLVAEEMFASGCELLISVTSSGQITAMGKPPYFVLIDRALRDEGTSYHYLPASDYAAINLPLLDQMQGAFAEVPVPVHQGATWTTDAPFRETAGAIEFARTQGILAVEMEAAALYAYAQACDKAIICFAHVTNQMATVESDFEKGEEMGSRAALAVIGAAARRWLQKNGEWRMENGE